MHGAIAAALAVVAFVATCVRAFAEALEGVRRLQDDAGAEGGGASVGFFWEDQQLWR